MENILELVKNLDIKDLNILYDKINEIIKSKSNEVEVILEYNKFKGTGKCWIAEIEKDSKKILKFVKAYSVDTERYKGYKTFKLKNGYYMLNETGSKSYDQKKYVQVINGKIKDLN